MKTAAKRGRKTRVINNEETDITVDSFNDIPVIMSLPIKEEDLIENKEKPAKTPTNILSDRFEIESIRSSTSNKTKKESNEALNKLKEMQVVLKYYRDIVDNPRSPQLTIKEFQLFNGQQIMKTDNNIPYPPTSDLACWWCTLNFDNIPIGMPIRTIEENERKQYHCVGNFCGFNCALAYSNDLRDGYDNMENRKNMLMNMFFDGYKHCEHMKKTNFWKKTMEVGIPPSPSFRLLPKYTGEQVGNFYTQKNYRIHYFAHTVEVDDYPPFQTRMILPPLCSQKITVEEDYRDIILPKIDHKAENKMSAQEASEFGEKVQRKKDKIMKKVKSHTLDMGIGIIISED